MDLGRGGSRSRHRRTADCGFLLLPFAVGAAAAAILAFAGASPVWQLLAFTIVSVGFLVLLQRFARRREDDDRRPGRAPTATTVEPPSSSNPSTA